MDAQYLRHQLQKKRRQTSNHLTDCDNYHLRPQFPFKPRNTPVYTKKSITACSRANNQRMANIGNHMKEIK